MVATAVISYTFILGHTATATLLGSIDVVDTNLACVYPDHLIDW